MEDRIIGLLRERGPQTGAQLRNALGDDGFAHWKTCMGSERIEVRRVGQRYLRLDKKVKGFARQSPSILREFRTYSMVGLAAEPAALDAATNTLAARVRDISAAKLKMATRFISEIGGRLAEDGRECDGAAEDRYCVLLAGDIVYEMGHDAPRPERSTGTMVRGSDVDLVVIMNDGAPDGLKDRLDDAIYQQKYRYLINPSIREEIDYVIKDLARIGEQAAFDTFNHMVSCKILDEAMLLYGNHELYKAAKSVLEDHGIRQKLAALEAAASHARELAEQHLLNRDATCLDDDELYLFYTSEESEEFE